MVVALRKSDLYSSLWSSADELRGSMDSSQYKDYVLTLLFVKYVSDKAKSDPYSLITIPDGGSFDDLIAMKGKAEIGDMVNKAIVKLAEANDLAGVLDTADFDDKSKLGDGKELVDRLSKLIGIFQDINFSGSKAEGDDLLGDAYEYLMRHFATESGKSKGQFYTPAEVSRVMAQLLQIPPNTPKSTTVYDPTCGSGSLLIKVADASPHGLSIYGQENDNATWALARMNMILHGNETHDIRQGNTLADPKFRKGDSLETFDYVVANPPFSVKTWKNGVQNNFGRFDGFDTPPDKNGDFAFLLHLVKSLKSTGKGAVIMPHGVLFRGNAEANIRKALIKRGLIKAIIGLPANLFYGTGIPACIIVLDKLGAADRKGIFMIDASKGFEKDGPKNRLRPRDMHKIVDAFVKQTDIDRYSRFVPNAEISSAKNDYNLNMSRYIDSSEVVDLQDISAHLFGGIPDRDLDALSPYWEAFPSLRSVLFEPLRDGYSRLIVEKSSIAETVASNSDYRDFLSGTAEAIVSWWTSHRQELEAIGETTYPSDLAGRLSEDLLATFRERPLLDEYSVYEQFMSYWNDVMHDDVALIIGEGWTGASKPRPARTWKDRNGKTKYEDANLQFGSGANAKRWVMDLIPPEYVIAKFFEHERNELDELSAELDAVVAAIDEFVDEHAVEDGLLWETVDDEGKIGATTVRGRLAKARAENADAEEITALEHLTALYTTESNTRRAIRNKAAELDEKAFLRYGSLTDIDTQSLAIHEKWGKTIGEHIAREVTELSQMLISRLRALAVRYEFTVPELDNRYEALKVRVADHLAVLGVSGS